jgi:hypothetical protein
MTGVAVTFLKPRLYPRVAFHKLFWVCRLPGNLDIDLCRIKGEDYNPKEAYDDWLTQFNRYRLFGEGK